MAELIYFIMLLNSIEKHCIGFFKRFFIQQECIKYV